MEASAEACWRLSKACGQWAVESRDSAARTAFRQMATEWARLAFNEEFISRVGERIDPPSSESSEATPVEIPASSLLTSSSDPAAPWGGAACCRLRRGGRPAARALMGHARAPLIGNFGCTLGGSMGKDREPQIILKTDQRNVHP
jgi:hypothetical protein